MRMPAIDLQELSDEMLMEQIVAHDQSAITALFHRHGKFLRNIIFQVLQDQAEADDVLQESLMQIWREAKSYCVTLGQPLGWLVTIARRRAIDRLRRRAAYSRAKTRFETYVGTEPHSWLKDCVKEDNCAPDSRRFLQNEMNRLPEPQSEVLRLSFFSGLSQREIAAQTGTPLGTVKTRLELGLRKLSNNVLAQRGKV